MLTPFDQLIGLKLSIARRAGSMRGFHFGRIHLLEDGTAGDYALHIQCPWRLDGPDGTVTGSSDLWEHTSGMAMPDEWEPNEHDNVQDARLGNLLKGYDLATRSHINITDQLVVEQVEMSKHGDVTIELLGGYSLAIFPAGSVGEQWRIFRPSSDERMWCLRMGS